MLIKDMNSPKFEKVAEHWLKGLISHRLLKCCLEEVGLGCSGSIKRQLTNIPQNKKRNSDTRK